MEDYELFNGLKSGDRESIKKIYINVLPSVKTWIVRNSGSNEDAEDVFQECLEIILLKIDHLQSSLSGLILQLSKRRWIDRIRKNKTRKGVSIVLAQRLYTETINNPLIEEQESEYQRYQIMESTFKNLSETCQKLLTLTKKSLSTEEIVHAMAFNSINTLYRRKAACISRWSQLVQEIQSEHN